MTTDRVFSAAAGKAQVLRQCLERIVSGGQTGADRAALDVAIRLGIPHGGWCPQGRLAEDGVIGPVYQLRETPSSDYLQRTEWNVRDSDATVILTIAPTLSGGSRATWEFAQCLGKPCLHVSRTVDGPRAAEELTRFILLHKVHVLNIAGPRQSTEAEVGPFVMDTMCKAMGGDPT